jgi:pimeloyl-ACP methyl ester carboxylesterase
LTQINATARLPPRLEHGIKPALQNRGGLGFAIIVFSVAVIAFVGLSGGGMPDCRLVIVPGTGHSMTLEVPALYAGYFRAWFGGLVK